NYPDCHVERSRNISDPRRRKEHRTLLIRKSGALSMEILHCAALRSERQQKGKVLQKKSKTVLLPPASTLHYQLFSNDRLPVTIAASLGPPVSTILERVVTIHDPADTKESTDPFVTEGVA